MRYKYFSNMFKYANLWRRMDGWSVGIGSVKLLGNYDGWNWVVVCVDWWLRDLGALNYSLCWLLLLSISYACIIIANIVCRSMTTSSVETIILSIYLANFYRQRPEAIWSRYAPSMELGIARHKVSRIVVTCDVM